MKTVFQGKVFTVKQSEEKEEEPEIAERSPSVGVIPFTSKGKIILLREYRKEHKKSVVGIIAGGADKDTDMQKEAERELAEEAKVKANKIKLFYRSKLHNKLKWDWYIFVATELTPVRATHDEDEQITPFECTLDEACEYTLGDNFRSEIQAYLLLKLRHDLKTGKFKLP